ncbi:hypothetical protein J6590_040228 [Homalodisca vitripennis]|nr:hypothetical protein J6590_040228 [Homalodisca vitripennis]
MDLPVTYLRSAGVTGGTGKSRQRPGAPWLSRSLANALAPAGHWVSSVNLHLYSGRQRRFWRIVTRSLDLAGNRHNKRVFSVLLASHKIEFQDGSHKN